MRSAVENTFGVLGVLGMVFVAVFVTILATQEGTSPAAGPSRKLAAAYQPSNRKRGSAKDTTRPKRVIALSPDRDRPSKRAGQPGGARSPVSTAGPRVAVPAKIPNDLRHRKNGKARGRPASGKNTPPVQSNARGDFALRAREAKLFGKALKFRSKNPAITNWKESKAYVRWGMRSPEAGAYEVQITYGCSRGAAGTPFAVLANGAKIPAQTVNTGGLAEHKMFHLGTFELPKGLILIAVRPLGQVSPVLMELVQVRLVPVQR